jgi:hypothetical protein
LPTSFAPGGVVVREFGKNGGGRARKAFFLKKEAKTFEWLSRTRRQRIPNFEKFFGSFFQKRTAFFPRISPTKQVRKIRVRRQRQIREARPLFTVKLAR